MSSSFDTDRIHEIAEKEGGAGDTREFRIFGPPGTGKTTNLSRQVRRAVDRYGPHAVLVTSFSRAAATELAGRDLPIAANSIGTLHSHCWHALGGPEIAEANVEEWNRDNPGLIITPVKKQGKLDGEESGKDEEDSETTKLGDERLGELNRLRGKLWPRGGWPKYLREFADMWSEYKRENGLLDFADLIEAALHEIAVAPGNPSVIFADEAQDLNGMQLKLVRKWGERANYFIVAGDDDQTIYSFTGATPDAFLDPDVPDDHKIVLKQSYRVPRAVHAVAEALIARVKRRQPKVYMPRDEAGHVEWKSGGGYKRTEIAIIPEAIKHIEQGKTVMFLASCSYMLRPIVAALRNEGVPFHNPYRRANGSWNPLRIGTKGSTAGRVLALLSGGPGIGEHPWTNGDVIDWAEVLNSKGVLRHGAKTRLATFDRNRPATLDAGGIFLQCFEESGLAALAQAWDNGHRELLKWWQSQLIKAVQPRAEFPAQVALKFGAGALSHSPKAIIGTIHSVKGGQADVVYLFPDLSQAGAQEYAGEGIDSVIRLFYVGITRARERLVVCPPESPLAISIYERLKKSA